MGRLTEADPKDVCACGDYRDQHDERGACKLNGVGHFGSGPCTKFRLFRRAALTQEPPHGR